MADGPVPDLDSASLERALGAALAERDAWAQESFESNRFSAQLAVERQGLADELATVEARVRAEAARDVDAARRERDEAMAGRERAVQAEDQARAAQLAAEARLARVTGSTSWRLTAPLRHGMTLLLGRERGEG